MPLRFLDDLRRKRGSRPRVEDAVLESEHRIANNLAIIAGLVRAEAAKLRADPHRNFDTAISVLAGLSARIEAIAQLHRLLTKDRGAAQIDVAEYLREVIKAAKSALNSGDRMGFQVRTEIKAHSSRAAAMGLFLSEAVTNALKHADGTDIGIMLQTAGENLLLEVTDSGPGLPSGFVEESNSGFRVMRSLASRLNGHVEFDQSNGNGLCVRLIMPLSGAASPASDLNPVVGAPPPRAG